MDKRIPISMVTGLTSLWLAQALAQNKFNPPPVAAQPPIIKTNPAPPVFSPPLPTDPTGGQLKDRMQQIDGARHGTAATKKLDKDLESDAAMGASPGGDAAIGSAKASVASIVSDRVLKTGNKISGGWREYSADRSWRRVVFTLEDHTATIMFSDGMPGRRLPSVTHFARSGPGPKGSPATYHEARIFAGASPVILDKAKRSSPIPSDVAKRIRDIGGNIKVMQQLTDLKRVAELGSALDAMHGAHDADGVFPDRPGGSPGKGNWKTPGGEVGPDGRASDGTSSRPRVVRHPGGSRTTTINYNDGAGNTRTESTDKDASGRTTGGGSYSESGNGDRTTTSYTRDSAGGSVTRIHIDYGDDRPSTDKVQIITPDGTTFIITLDDPIAVMPSETGGGSFDEAWLYGIFPWMGDQAYIQWKRESDLVRSGGRIAQPGRDEPPTLVFNEGPEVGVNGVVNCGAETNPCARPAGVAVDPRGGFGSISQPGRGVGPDAPAETGVPLPIPEPPPQ